MLQNVPADQNEDALAPEGRSNCARCVECNRPPDDFDLHRMDALLSRGVGGGGYSDNVDGRELKVLRSILVNAG